VSAVRRRLGDERGFTIVELLIVCATLGVVLTGLVNVFVSGSRAGSDADARFRAQQTARLALDRLQFEARCASAATVVSAGAGVTLTLPGVCAHATGSVTWCVSAGTLMRYAGAGCSGSGTPFVRSVTSPTPFALPATPSGDLPQLQVTIAANVAGRPSDAFTLGDAITLRNAAPA
jgi:Tfp pilus assembly protein PilW